MISRPVWRREAGADTMELQARILVVDDESDATRLFFEVFKRKGYEVIEAADGTTGVRLAHESKPDVILLDIDLPDIDGFEVCRLLKTDAATSAIPIIFVSAHFMDEVSKVTALSIGGNDFITKPYSIPELAARVAVMVRIKKAEDALRYQSVTDGLTGLYNRRFTFARLDEELSRAKRHNLSIACVVIDLDHFKKVNDEYGHLAGDTALRKVSEMLLRHARKEDLPCRYGGEEFLLVLPQTHTAGAVTLTERIRESLEKEAIRTDEGLVHITLSAGIAAFPENGAATPDDLLRLADAALYEAKEKGRNRVVTYSAEKSN